MTREERLTGGLWCSILGDVIGVPVEFLPREALASHPVAELRSHGSHNQPEGTWSDDSSLLLCSIENILEKGNLETLMKKFESWLYDGLWTPGGVAFDVGIATGEAIRIFQGGEPAVLCGGIDEWSNGNGSLMRILPYTFLYSTRPEQERRTGLFNTSAVTHGHSRSKLACWLYSEIVRNLLAGLPKTEAIDQAHTTVATWTRDNDPDQEWRHFARCLSTIEHHSVDEIKSSGYVVDTLEAALYSFLKTEGSLEALYFAANLGCDTDTVATVTGGLVGTFYGLQAPVQELMPKVLRSDDIGQLIGRFVQELGTV